MFFFYFSQCWLDAEVSQIVFWLNYLVFKYFYEENNLKHKTVNCNKKRQIFIERGRWISKNHSLDMDIPTLIWIFIFWSRPSLIFELHTTCFHELPIPKSEFSRMFEPISWVYLLFCQNHSGWSKHMWKLVIRKNNVLSSSIT